MIAVIVCFVVFWSAFKITDFLVIIEVRSLVPNIHIQYSQQMHSHKALVFYYPKCLL